MLLAAALQAATPGLFDELVCAACVGALDALHVRFREEQNVDALRDALADFCTTRLAKYQDFCMKQAEGIAGRLAGLGTDERFNAAEQCTQLGVCKAAE